MTGSSGSGGYSGSSGYSGYSGYGYSGGGHQHHYSHTRSHRSPSRDYSDEIAAAQSEIAAEARAQERLLDEEFSFSGSGGGGHHGGSGGFWGWLGGGAGLLGSLGSGLSWGSAEEGAELGIFVLAAGYSSCNVHAAPPPPPPPTAKMGLGENPGKRQTGQPKGSASPRQIGTDGPGTGPSDAKPLDPKGAAPTQVADPAAHRPTNNGPAQDAGALDNNDGCTGGLLGFQCSGGGLLDSETGTVYCNPASGSTPGSTCVPLPIEAEPTTGSAGDGSAQGAVCPECGARVVGIGGKTINSPDPLASRLLKYTNQALSEWESGRIGYSAKDLTRIARKPSRANTIKGNILDRRVKELTDSDPALGELFSTPSGMPGPDWINTGTSVPGVGWYDLTTEVMWGQHVYDYGPRYGPGVGILWQ